MSSAIPAIVLAVIAVVVFNAFKILREYERGVIFTLGRFNLLSQGQSLDYGRKVPHRPLVFLKTLIALGGRDISSSSIASALWPEAEGDNAQRSFDTTLYRLRKMLADDRILVLRDGKVSLDPRFCWVDVWSFERLLGIMQRIRNEDTTGKDAYQLDQLIQRIMSLYQDHFLAREEATAWSVSMRERLRSKFIYSLLDLGRYWELHGFWDKAIRLQPLHATLPGSAIFSGIRMFDSLPATFITLKLILLACLAGKMP